MPEVLEIIKRRWPEVVLVVGFQIGVFFLKTMFMEMLQEAQSMNEAQQVVYFPFWVSFLLGLGTMAFVIVAYMFLFGFVATACHEGLEKKEPTELLRAGRYFFWRMVRFEILFSIFWFALVMVLSVIVGTIAMQTKTDNGIPYWLFNICMFTALVILIKPLLSVPAIMIAKDKMVLEATKLLKEFSLMQAKDLLALVSISLLVMFGLSFVLGQGKTGNFHYLITGIYAVISSCFLLLIGLTAVRFIAIRTTSAEEQTVEEQA